METDDVILTLSALAQPTRLEAFRRLVSNYPESIHAGDLARQLNVPQNTASAHLAILTRAGLIEGMRQSRNIAYRAKLETFRRMTGFLLNDCCGGRSDICAPPIVKSDAASTAICNPAGAQRAVLSIET